MQRCGAKPLRFSQRMFEDALALYGQAEAAAEEPSDKARRALD